MSAARAARWGFGILGLLILIAIVAAVASWFWVKNAERGLPGDPTPGVVPLLAQPIAAGPQTALLQQGRALVIAGDCISCHTRQGGHPFAGGLGLKTPFGVIYSPNITGDPQTGLGDWTADQFYRALHHGIAPGGAHLYPAFPYTDFTIVTRADSDAMLAYLKTVPAVSSTKPANLLPFPANLRPSMIVWNALFFHDKAFQPNSGRSPAWNRGAYLVNGLGHCAACHSPKTIAGSDKADAFLHGGELQNWIAPDLTSNPRTGLGQWSEADIVAYLRDGRNARSNAAGPMAEVVTYSTSMMSDADLAAIATYLKSLPASPTPPVPAPDAGAMQRGAAIFSDACSACHLAQGQGRPGFFPPVRGSTMAQQANPDGLIHLILAGARTGPTRAHPAYPTMPSFAWKLDDQEVADVATFVRNNWGNKAVAVTADRVAKLRGRIGLDRPMGKQ